MTLARRWVVPLTTSTHDGATTSVPGAIITTREAG